MFNKIMNELNRFMDSIKNESDCDKLLDIKSEIMEYEGFIIDSGISQSENFRVSDMLWNLYFAIADKLYEI